MAGNFSECLKDFHNENTMKGLKLSEKDYIDLWASQELATKGKNT